MSSREKASLKFLNKSTKESTEMANNDVPNCKITPETVFRFSSPTNDYLCPDTANVFDIEFTRFTLRDASTHNVIVDIEKPASEYKELYKKANGLVRYNFPASFLLLEVVSATVEFKVGCQVIPNLRMIERHYFKNKLLKSFDFNFGFIMPSSTNTMEQIYEFPRLEKTEVQEMIACPYETKSDSFYFVDDKLVMQNKAEYLYY